MKTISTLSIVLLSLIFFVCCKEDTISSLPKMEAQIGEAFTITGPTAVLFTHLEGPDFTIELRKFSDYLVEGLVSPRTYVDVAIISDETTTYQIETGYLDNCYGEDDRFCNELGFQVNGQPLLLQFEEVVWSEPVVNSQGLAYISVQSASLIVSLE